MRTQETRIKTRKVWEGYDKRTCASQGALFDKYKQSAESPSTPRTYRKRQQKSTKKVRFWNISKKKQINNRGTSTFSHPTPFYVVCSWWICQWHVLVIWREANQAAIAFAIENIRKCIECAHMRQVCGGLAGAWQRQIIHHTIHIIFQAY